MISQFKPDFNQTPTKKEVSFRYVFDQLPVPEVTIITPFYNTGLIFEETIQCVLKQSFQNFEWIIINDCSTDPQSVNILNGLSERDKRIKVITNIENKGPAGSRNEGIDKALGKFLFFIDSDDLIEPTIIEKYWIFLKFNTLFAFCNAWHVGFGAQNYLWKRGFEQGPDILIENTIQPTFMARRELFKVVRFNESIRDGFEDWEFWLQCAKNGYWGYTIPEFLYWYRRVDNILEKWRNWDNGEKMARFRNQLELEYNDIVRSSFPKPELTAFFRGIDVSQQIISDLDVNKLKKSDKKRLLFVIPWISLGGADKFNLDLLTGLIKYDWEITIITTQHSENLWYAELSRCTPDIFILHNYVNDGFYTHVVEYLVNSRQPDCILISNSEIGYYLSPYIKQNFPSIPLVDYNHMEEMYWNNGGHPRSGIIYQSLFEYNIVSSRYLKDWMVKEGANEEIIEVVYTGSDCENVKQNLLIRNKLRSQWNVDDDLCIIAFSGRITHQKQPQVLFGVILELSRKCEEPFLIVIAGDGPDLQQLKNSIYEHKLTNKVKFMGSISNQENIELLQTSDVFFLPSLWEGISLAIYEAMCIGLPIVGADVGGQKELVRKDNGFLIERSGHKSEIESYTNKLMILLQNPDLRKTMGDNSRKIIEKDFGIEKMWFKMNHILNKAIQSNTSKGDLKKVLRQLYAQMFFERRLADELWHMNMELQQKGKKSSQSTITAEMLDHSWYHQNYEILPLWYKRFGHILKLIYGRRSLKSFVINKYKPDPNSLHYSEWYRIEYDSLPKWYKEFGKMLKKGAKH